MSNPFEKYVQASQRQTQKLSGALEKWANTPSTPVEAFDTSIAGQYADLNKPITPDPTLKSAGDLLVDAAASAAKIPTIIGGVAVGAADLALSAASKPIEGYMRIGNALAPNLIPEPMDVGYGYIAKGLHDTIGYRPEEAKAFIDEKLFSDARKIQEKEYKSGYTAAEDKAFQDSWVNSYQTQVANLQKSGATEQQLKDFNTGFDKQYQEAAAQRADKYQTSWNKPLSENIDIIGHGFNNLLENPSLALGGAIESGGYLLPSMLVSRGVRALEKAANIAKIEKVAAAEMAGKSIGELAITRSPFLAAGVGEGSVSGLTTLEQMRSQIPDGIAGGKELLGALGVAASTGLIGAGFGKAASQVGIGDIDAAGLGRAASQVAAMKLPALARPVGAIAQEGAEEFLQTFGESIIPNVTMGKDPLEGLGQELPMGTLAGAIMGAGMNAPSLVSGGFSDISSGLGKVKDATKLKSFETLSNPEHKNYNPAQAFNIQLKNLESADETVRTQAEASVSKIETDLDTARASVEERIKSIQATLKAMPPSDQTTDAQKLEIEALGKEYSELTTKSSTLADQYVAFLEAQVAAQDHRDAKQGTQFTEEQAKADIATLTQTQFKPSQAEQISPYTQGAKGETFIFDDDFNAIPVEVISDVTTEEFEYELLGLPEGETATGYKDYVTIRYTNETGEVVEEKTTTDSIRIKAPTTDEHVTGNPVQDTTAQQEALNRVTRHFSKYSNDDLDLLATSPVFNEQQRNSLRLMSESKRQLAAVQDPSQVFDNILNGYKGKTIQESHRGLNQYTDMVNTAVATKNEQLASLALDGLGAFTDDHIAKRDAINEAFGLVQKGTYKEIRVVRTEDGTWGFVPFTAQEVRAGKNADGVVFLEDDALKEELNSVGGFNVHRNSDTPTKGRTIGAITQINNETQLIQDRFNALSGVAESFVGVTPKPVDTSIAPTVDAPIVTEPSDTTAPVVTPVPEAPVQSGAPVTPTEPTETVADSGQQLSSLTKTASDMVKLPNDYGQSDIFKAVPLFKKENPTGIIAFRVNSKRTLLESLKDANAIGNPFNWQNPKIGVGNATKMFDEWLRTGKHTDHAEAPQATEEYRQAILSKLKENPTAKILYYKELNGASHANVLEHIAKGMQQTATPTETKTPVGAATPPITPTPSQDTPDVTEGATQAPKTADTTPPVTNSIKVVGTNTLITSAVSGLTHSVPTKLVNGIFEASYIVKELMAITSKALTPAQREYLEGLLQVFLALDGTVLVGLYADLSLIQNDTIRETLQKSKGKAVDYLDEGKRIYIDLNNVEPVDLFEILVHEYHHTVTMQGLKKVEGVGKSSPQYVRLNAAYKAVKAYVASNPTVDARVLERLKYMLKNLREFLTVGMVEPTVIEALRVISVSEGKSVYDEISAVNAEILKIQNPKTFPTQQGKLNDLVSTTRGNSSGVQTSSSDSLSTPQVESLDTTGNDTGTSNTVRPVATDDGEQIGRGTSEATQGAKTSTESQVEPVATEDAKVTVLQGVTDERAAEERKKPFNLRNILKGYFTQSTTKEDAVGANPLVTIKDFLKGLGTRTQVSDWLNDRRKPTLKQLEQVEHFKKFHTEFAKSLQTVLDSKRGDGINPRENLAEYLKIPNTRNLDENVVTALALSAYSYLIKQGNKVMNTNEELEKLLRLKKGMTVPYHIAQMFRFAGQEMPIVVKALGADTVKALGLKVRKNQDPTLQDRLNTSLGILALETMAKAELVVIDTLEDNPKDKTDTPLTDFLNDIERVRKSGTYTIQDEYDLADELGDKAKIGKFTMVRPNAKMVETTGNSVFKGEVKGTLNTPQLVDGLPILQSPLVNELIEANKETKGFLSYLFGVDVGYTMPKMESPEKFTQQDIHGTDASVPSSQVALLTEAQKHSFTMRTNTVAVLAKLKEMGANSQFLKELLGIWVDDHVLSRTHVTQRDSLQAKAQNDWTALLNGLEWAGITLDEQGEYQEFYDTQFVAQNQRQHLNSNMFNAQSSQIHRAMAALTGFSTTIDLSQDEQGTVKDAALLDLFYQAVGEGLEGLDSALKASIQSNAALQQFFTVDKVHGKYYVAALKEYLQTEPVQNAVSAMVGLVQGKTITEEEQRHIADFVAKGDMGVQSLQSLIALAELSIAQANGTTFTTTIGFGSDGVNHGVSAANALTGVISNEMRLQTGIFPLAPKAQIQDMQTVYEKGIPDYYVDFGKVMAKALTTVMDTFKGAYRDEFIQGMTALFPKFEAIKGNDDLVDPLSMRKISKTWSIPFNYSAGKAALQRALARGFLEGIYKQMNSLANSALDIKEAVLSGKMTPEAATVKRATLSEKRSTLEKHIKSVIKGYSVGASRDFTLPALELLNEDAGKFSNTIENYLMQGVIDLHGEAAWQATEQFAEKYLQVRNAYTEVEKASFTMFNIVRNQLITKKKLSRLTEDGKPLQTREAFYFDLTTKELAEVDAELAAMRPMFNTALSIPSESTNDANNTENPSGVSVRKQKMQREKASDSDRNVNANYGVSRQLGLTKEVEENAGVASSANAVQSIDAFVAAKVQGFMDALNVHDAAIFGLKNFLKGVKKQNEEHLRALTNYQLGLEHAKMLVKVYQGYKAFMATQTEALKTAEGKVKENIQSIINQANKEMDKLLKGEVIQREGKNLVIGGEVISKGGLIPKLQAAGLDIKSTASIEEAIGMFIDFAINQDVKKLGILKDTFGIHQFAGEGGMHQLTDENRASITEQEALVEKAKEDLQAELKDKTVEQVAEVKTPKESKPVSVFISFLRSFKDGIVPMAELLDHLKNRSDINDAAARATQGEVIKAITPLIDANTKVVYSVEDYDGYGYFDEGTNTLHINAAKEDGVKTTLAVHELLHAVLSRRIKTLRNDIENKTGNNSEAVTALQRLDTLRERLLLSITDPVLRDTLKNTDEFISYGLTDSRLQRAMKNVDVAREGRTVSIMFRKFVEYVGQTLGFKSKEISALSAFALDTAALLETIGTVTPVVASNSGERLFSTQSAEDRVNTKPEINTALEQARKAVRELLIQLNFKFVDSPDVNLSDIERIASKYLTEGKSNNDPAFLKDAAIALSYAIYSELGLPQGNAKMREWLEQSLLDWLTTGEIPKLHKSVWVKAVEIFNKIMAAFSGKEFKAIESRLEATLNKIINREDFSFKPKQGYAKLVFQKEMTNNPLAVQSLLTFIKSGIKFALTGSVAYADQVPLYRQENKPLHDMDFLVAPEDLQDAYDYFTQKDPDNWGGSFTLYDVVKEGKRILGFAIVPKGFVIKNGKSEWNREQKAPERSYDVFNVVTGLKAGSYYFLGGKEEVFTGVAGITIDLLAEDARDTVTQTFKDTTGTNKSIEVSSYVGGFTAKLDMLRLKDITDFIGVVPPTERVLSKPKAVKPTEEPITKPAPAVNTIAQYQAEAAALEDDALDVALSGLLDKQRKGDKSPLLKMKFKAYNDEMNKRGAAVSNKGERRYSKNTLSGNGLTVASTRQILVKQFGEKLIKVLEAKGLLRIVETMAETPEAALESNTEGYYLNGKATLVADGLTPETVVATLLHELSGHKGFQELMEPAAYNALMKQFNKLVAEGNPIALAALKRAQEATGSDGKPLSLQGQMDEYLPYLLTIQAAINATQAQKSAVAKFIDNVFRAVRAWAYKKLQANGYEGAASTFMQPQDIVFMAERMLREMANSSVTPSNTQSPIKFSTQSAEDLVNGQSSLDIMTALPHSNTGAFNQQLDRLITEEIGQLYNQDDAAKARIDEIQTLTASDALNAGFTLSRKEQYVQQALQYAVAAYMKLHAGGANVGQLRRVYHAAKAKMDITGKDFHEGDWATATQQEKDIAKAKYDFMFDSTKEGYMSRFVSMALASEAVNKLLDIALPLTKPETQDKTWFETVNDWVSYVMAWLTNKYVRLNPVAGASNQLVQLMDNLVKLDIRNRQEGVALHQKAWNTIGLVTTPLNKALKGAGGAVLSGVGLRESRFLPVRALGAILVLRSEEAAKAIPKMIIDMRNNQLPNTKLGEVANILLEASGVGTLRDKFDVLIRQTNLNAKNRQDIVDGVKKAVNKWFKEPLTKVQSKAIAYGLLGTDAQALLENYSVEDIVGMALHEGKLNVEIAKLKKEIAKNPNGNDMLNAAEQLGYYMVTRIGGEGLVKNALGISIGLGTQYFTSVEQADPKLVGQLNTLVSMLAMTHVPNSDKAVLAALYKTDAEGIHATIQLHQGLVNDSLKDFQANPLNMVKGWMPEVTNPYLEIKAANSMVERQQMEAEGWVLIDELKRDKHDKGSPKYLMKHNDIGYQRLVSGAVDLGSTARSGTEAISRTSPKYLGITQARYQNAARRAAIPNGSFDPSKQPRGLIAAYDTNGMPLAYNYEMDNETRDAHLDRKHNIGDLLGTFGGLNYYKPEKAKQSNKVAEVLFEDYKANYSQNPNAYLKISHKSTDPKVVEMWRMLPQDFKQRATELYGKGNPIIIRNEAFNLAFGFKKFSVVSYAFDAVKAERERIKNGLVGTGKSPNAFQSGFVRLAEATRGNTAQADFAKAEHVTQEIVKAIKDFIVIRSGTTMMWNIFANVLMLMANGINPVTIVKDWVFAVTNVRAYQKLNSQLIQAQADLVAGKDPVALKQKIGALKAELKANVMNPYINAGLLSSIVDDVNIQHGEYTYTSAFKQTVDEKTQWIPKPVKTAAAIATIAPSTKLYQFLATTTQLSDFVAKYSMSKHLQSTGMAVDESIIEASKTFINYDLPTSQGLQYANDMGLFMFTKFFLRIQAVLMKLLGKRAGSAIAQHLLVENLTGAEGVLSPMAFGHIGNNPLESSVFGLPSAFFSIGTVDVVTDVGTSF